MMNKDMISLHPARESDAQRIAEMSRDYIESGLGWSWTRPRVIRAIRKPHSLVLNASIKRRFAGFGIIKYFKHRANLNLLAVEPEFRNQGVGTTLVNALEKSATDLSIENLYIQVRESNRAAHRFYQRLGYEMIDRNGRYYSNQEAAIILYKYCPSKQYGITGKL